MFLFLLSHFLKLSLSVLTLLSLFNLVRDNQLLSFLSILCQGVTFSKTLIFLNARLNLGLGGTSHTDTAISLKIVNHHIVSFLLKTSLAFGKKHQFEFFYFRIKLIEHVLLHG